MGDVTPDMDRTPFFARGPALVLVALLVAAGALGLVALMASRGSGAHGKPAAHRSKAPAG